MDSATASDPTPEYISAARAAGLRLRQSAPIRRGPPPFELPILTFLKSHRTILASASPRRKALLAQLGLTDLEILPSTIPEDISKATHTPHEYVSATARQKCMHVYETAIKQAEEEEEEGAEAKDEPACVIAADTIIVTRNGQVLEKPRNEEDHKKMLRHLRDTQFHRVLTAVCVMAPKADASHPGYEIASLTEETRVYFAQEEDGLTDDVIDAYVAMREGADKAGGYAVQGIGGMMLVEKLDGPVDNVVGLPVRKCLKLCEKVCFMQGEEEVASEEE
ncbi:Maf-like protein-domain-containing protein [Coniochaeta sp. 2T2.1]|nr:Maf-like protein-domain-containing protein [Coniochaeta sp. 2T2.1]